MSKGTPLLGLLAVLVVSSALPAQKVEVTDNSPVAWKLASIDHESTFLDRNLLQRYEYTLEQTVEKCQEGRQQVADMALKATQILEEEKGVEMRAYRMLQSADDAVPPSAAPQKCSDIFALLVTQIEPN